jgi:hypothetical protein
MSEIAHEEPAVPDDPISTAIISFVTGEWIKGVVPGTVPPLFHYTNAEGLKGIVESKSLWASHVAFMNDPMEMNYAVALCREILSEHFLGQMEDASPTKMEVLLYESVTRALDRIGDLLTGFVFCFCEKDDLLSQWRGYGDLSSAFSIGIDLNELGTLTLARGDIRKVVYELEQQREMILRYMTDWLLVLQNLLDQDALDFAQLQLLRVGFIMGFAPIALSIKAPAFQEECEWRLITIRMHTSQGDSREDYPTRIRNGLIVPYLVISEPTSPDASPRLPITSVRVGPSSDVTVALRGVKNLLRFNKILVDPVPSAFQLR